MQYEATKKVKEEIVLKEVNAELQRKKKEMGIDGLA